MNRQYRPIPRGALRNSHCPWMFLTHPYRLLSTPSLALINRIVSPRLKSNWRWTEGRIRSTSMTRPDTTSSRRCDKYSTKRWVYNGRWSHSPSHPRYIHRGHSGHQELPNKSVPKSGISSSRTSFNWTFQADAVVLCFSVGSRSSFVNIEHKWWRELQKPICRRRVPIILVATKSDLRKCSPSSEVVTTGEGIQLCNRINARAFLECSASTQTNIAEVIYESVRAAVRFSAAEEGIENLSDNEDSGGGDGSTDDHPSVVGFCLFHRQSGGNLRCNRRSFRHWFHKCLWTLLWWATDTCTGPTAGQRRPTRYASPYTAVPSLNAGVSGPKLLVISCVFLFIKVCHGLHSFC